MSSHHFVKEGQEPALLILDGNFSEVTASLLEWSPLIIVSAAAAPGVLLRGIKIDIIICDKRESLTEAESLMNGHGPVAFLTCDEDSSAFVTALLHLVNAGETAVNVIASDAIPLFQQSQTFSRRILITIFEGCWKSSAIAGGRYEKWLPEKAVLKVHGQDALQAIATEGLKGNGPDFEAISSGNVQVLSDGTFWVSEQYC